MTGTPGPVVLMIRRVEFDHMLAALAVEAGAELLSPAAIAQASQDASGVTLRTRDGRELRAPMGNRIYGCDDCLAVCPWNKFAQAGREAKLAARESLRAPKLAELARLDDAAFRTLFAKSPVKRTGRDRFVRNVLIAIGNSGDVTLAAEAERLLDDAAPLVRGAAVWALARLDPARFAQLSAMRGERESDASVRDEWIAA